MRVVQDEPFDIQPQANAALARALRGGARAALVLAVAGVLAPGLLGDVMGWAALSVVVAVPLGRVALLAVVVAGGAIALLTR